MRFSRRSLCRDRAIVLIGLGLMVLALSFMLFGCGSSSGSTGPSMSDIGNAGFTSGDQHPDQSCLHDAQGNKIPDPQGPKGKGPKPPVVPPVEPPVTPPPAKVCDDPHYGGGNSGVDCGKDNPNKINGINDGPTKGKK